MVSDILDHPGRITPDEGRRHGWRQTASEEPELDEHADATEVGDHKRGVGVLVALALVTAAAMIIVLAFVTVTAGQPDVEVVGTTEVADRTPTTAVTSTTAAATTEAPASSVVLPTVPRSPIFVEPGELTLTTFYRVVPVDGGDFSLAVRLENSSENGFAIADAEFAFEVGAEMIAAEEVITEHTRVPAGGSAVVTLRVDLPAGVTPSLVVSSIDGELARALLP